MSTPPPLGIVEILGDVRQRLEKNGATISLHNLLRLLGERGFALVFILFALPAILPFGIPGVAVIFGLPLILFSLQWVSRAKTPWLPRFLAAQEIPTAALASMIAKALPHCAKLERYLKPRWGFVFTLPGETLLGLLVLLHAAILPWPIPFGNTGPALSITLIGLALLAGDGLAAAIAAALAAAIAALMSGAVLATLQLMWKVVKRLYG